MGAIQPQPGDVRDLQNTQSDRYPLPPPVEDRLQKIERDLAALKSWATMRDEKNVGDGDNTDGVLSLLKKWEDHLRPSFPHLPSVVGATLKAPLSE